MIDEATRRAIKAVDLPALVSRDRALRKEAGGRRYRGLCPFHAEHTPSFVVYRNRDGHWRWRCFGRCQEGGDAADYVQRSEPGWDFAAVLRFLGIQPGPPPARQFAPVTPPPGVSSRPRPLGPLVAAYDYRFEDGTLHYQECKHEPKDFRQRRPDGCDGWTYNLDGIEPLPFRLPELIADLAARPDDWLWLCEGGKDADRARAGGLIATTKSGGAGAPLPARLLPLVRGRTVVIAYDNDESGRAGADADADELCRAGATVIILDLGRAWPTLPVKGDVSDFLDAWPVDVLHMLARVAPVLPAVDPDTGEIGGDPGAGEYAALIAEIEQALAAERAAREAAETKEYAAEQRARYLLNWQKLPKTVLPGVKAVAPFVAFQYKQRVSACEADDEGWVRISLAGLVASSTLDPLPPPAERTPEQIKAVRNRADQYGDYLLDMAALGWIEVDADGPPMQDHGQWIAHPWKMRVVERAFLDNPAALPYPTEKRARVPKKPACPTCGSTKTRQIVMCVCEHGHTFPLPADDNPTPESENSRHTYSPNNMQEEDRLMSENSRLPHGDPRLHAFDPDLWEPAFPSVSGRPEATTVEEQQAAVGRMLARGRAQTPRAPVEVGAPL